MSAQFGICNFVGRPVESDVLDTVRPLLAPYGPDDEGLFRRENAIIFYRALQTTRESHNERQPHISASGLAITWDGRLDNREELIRKLGGRLSPESTDLAIAALAYEKWDTESFQNLIGDWALSVWNPSDRSLILAKDFSGTRQLFYRIEKQQITWCTALEPLLLLAGHSFKLEGEYIAGWFSQFPRCELSPYVEVRSVPPASFVRVTETSQSVTRFWDFNPSHEVHLHSDREYEEHFRFLLSESVRRRLRSDSTITAELSGGMDSSSIVCLAHSLINKAYARTGRLETISYYNNSEPNWNELPYLTEVEEKIEKKGHHINAGLQNPFQLDLECARLMTTPVAAEFSAVSHDQFRAAMVSSGSRVLLTGTGGDEITGGVPTPLPELQDLLARVHLRQLAHQLKHWALNKRRPWIHLLLEAAAGFLPSTVYSLPKHLQPAPWINKRFVTTYGAAFTGYDRRLKVLESLPSFQQNVAAFNLLRRQLGCEVLPAFPHYEKRYPYLDRDLVEFMYAIPREQVVRPGQRRSLMRRALTGIVPAAVLERRRKAYVAHAGLAVISSEWPRLQQMFQRSLSGTLGFINDASFLEALDSIRHGRDVSMVLVARTLLLEIWLRNLEKHGILDHVDDSAPSERVLECERSQLRKTKAKGGDNNEVRETGTDAARNSTYSDPEQRHPQGPEPDGQQPQAVRSGVRG